MTFKTYRAKGTIEARMVDRDYKLPDDTAISKGDYEVLRDGKLEYQRKEAFEQHWEPTRAPRVRQAKSKRKKPTPTNTSDSTGREV